MQRPNRQPNTFFLVAIALVACATINAAFVPSRDFAVLYTIPVLVASLIAPPFVVVLTAMVGFGIDVVDLVRGQDEMGAWLIGLTTFLIVGGACALVSAQRQEIDRRARDAERLAENLRAVTDQLRAIIQATPLAIVALDPSERVTLWNPGAERILGWSESEVVGASIPPSLRPLAAKLLSRNGGRSTDNAEASDDFCIERRDGAAVDVRAHAAPLRLSPGGESGLVIVLADTSDQKRAERALRQAAESETAQRVAHARLEGVRLAARSTAHLVNNQLAETVGYLDLLRQRRRLPVDVAATIDRSLLSIEAATHQITRLQQVVRVETWETPVGPALDLDRSAALDDRKAS